MRSLARRFLPAKWRTVVDLIAAPIPSTPHGTVPAPNDAAVRRLEAIDHIVVVMLENRSFDHMLGYLSLPPDLGGRKRGDVDGLTGPEVNFNENDGQRYPIHHLTAIKFKDETEDPDHSGPSVDVEGLRALKPPPALRPAYMKNVFREERELSAYRQLVTAIDARSRARMAVAYHKFLAFTVRLAHQDAKLAHQDATETSGASKRP